MVFVISSKLNFDNTLVSVPSSLSGAQGSSRNAAAPTHNWWWWWWHVNGQSKGVMPGTVVI